MNLLEDGIPLVRRYTGGGAAFSDKGCVAYIMFYPSSADKEYKKTHGGDLPLPTVDLIIPALNKLGVPCARSGRNDIVVENRKVPNLSYVLF